MEPLKKLGLDPETATELAMKLHAHSAQFEYELASTVVRECGLEPRLFKWFWAAVPLYDALGF